MSKFRRQPVGSFLALLSLILLAPHTCLVLLAPFTVLQAERVEIEFEEETTLAGSSDSDSWSSPRASGGDPPESFPDDEDAALALLGLHVPAYVVDASRSRSDSAVLAERVGRFWARGPPLS